MCQTAELKVFLEHGGHNVVGVNNTAGIQGWKRNSSTNSQGNLMILHSVAAPAAERWLL